MKTLRFLLLMLLTLGGVDRAIYLGGTQVIAASPNRFAQLYHGELTADLLILGNSRADEHFDTAWLKRELGIRAVNLGLGGNHMVLNAILLEDYLERHAPPKTVIIEITSLLVRPEEMGDFLVFAPASARLDELAGRLTPRFALTGQALQALWLNNDMFLRMAQEMLRAPAPRVGARTGTNRMTPEVRNRVLPIREVSVENLEALARIQAVTDAAGIRLIPVVTPYAMPPQNIRGLDKFLEQAATVLGPVRIRDYSAVVQDPAQFSNPTHLNVQGMLAFNRHIFLEERLLER